MDQRTNVIYSSLSGLQNQCNCSQNLNKNCFCRHCQTDSKIYMEMQRIENDKRIFKMITICFQELLEKLQ